MHHKSERRPAVKNLSIPRVASLLFMALLPAFGQAVYGQAEDAVKVNARPATVKYETFDPRNKPANMPSLKGNEAATCQAQFGVGAQVEVEVTEDKQADGQHAVTAKVEGITVSTNLAITIWLPRNAAAAIKAHEEGHRKISESFYKDAEKIARSAASGCIGKSLSGRGRTTDSAANAAISQVTSQINGKYMAATQLPAAKVNEAFDEITDHGRKKIAVEKAIEMAMARK
jgi:hypothetical protein